MDERYWIAINHDSCALCSYPLKEPLVTPTPQQLFGFLTLEEAERAQRTCLMAPMKKVHKFIKDLAIDVKIGRVRHIRPEHPQPPTKEATAWTDSDEAHAIMQRAFNTAGIN
jgi:DNA-binding response OmpR family regulator